MESIISKKNLNDTRISKMKVPAHTLKSPLLL